MKPCGIAAGMLASTFIGLNVSVSATAANGANPVARTTAEYREAIARAEKDYAAANRRCEVLRMSERKLCVHDSAVARGAAIIEAQSRRSHIAQAAR
jgi:hypothetical protein